MLQIAFVHYYAAGAKFGARECHGTMPWTAHQEFHQTLGTYYTSGADLTSYTLSSTTAANRRPDVGAVTIRDEDLPTALSALSTKTYTQFYLSGAGATANFVTGASDIVPLSGNQPYYNQFTG